MDYIKKEDANRYKYLKSHFFREPDDPTLYHLTINTGLLSYEESAIVIADALIKKFPKSFVE
jgi:cytidylate kinase